MSGSLDELNITDIKDPFAMANCDPDDIESYQSKSRDTMRTPMQVGSINIYLISNNNYNIRYLNESKPYIFICRILVELQ